MILQNDPLCYGRRVFLGKSFWAVLTIPVVMFTARAGSAEPHRLRPAPPRRSTAMMVRKPPCERPSIEIWRGATREKERFPLTGCDGKPAANALDRLSLLLRPANVARSHDGMKIKPVDAGLLPRLQAVANRYRGRPFIVVSGYRPESAGSYHQEARAVDVRLEGVKNEDLVAFCRTLPDTGCGYYPNSTFIHLDVRPPGSGHVHWIDASGPGQSPHYVTAWPPPPGEEAKETTFHEGIVPHDTSMDGDDVLVPNP